MGAWAGKRERPRANMDHARSLDLDQSRGSSQRFLSDRSRQRKELLFPPAYAFLSVRIRNLTQCTRQQIFPACAEADDERQLCAIKEVDLFQLLRLDELSKFVIVRRGLWLMQVTDSLLVSSSTT